MSHPLLILISSPSGAGKSTLCKSLLAEFDSIRYSISCTTRKPRGAEVDGQAYHFMSRETFQARIEQGDFLEHAEVHGNLYGTLKASVLEAFERGQSILMDIDVAGAAQLRAYVATLPETDPIRRGFVDIFISAPSFEELRRRITGRGEDSPETIELRMHNAIEEMKSAPLYRYQIVNDELARAYAEFRSIILSEQQDPPTL